MRAKVKEPGSTIAFKNVFTVFKAMFQRYHSATWQVPSYILCKVSGPFLSTMIPTVAITYITRGSIGDFIPAMLGVLLLAAIINTFTGILHSGISNKCNFTRRGHFCYQYIDKNLSTDYSNVEPQERQDAIRKGAMAINSGWIGTEQLMKQSIELVVSLCGLALYGLAVIFLDYRILLIMIVMFLLDFAFRNNAIRFQDSLIDENSGEAQKIAIARALYKDAPLVVLDEPTSALDPVSEYDIYRRFDSLVKNKASIYISHRMSSCRFCDMILVFDRGRIVQSGSHNELLLDTENVYFKLWNAQAQYYSG